jgi:hypothetical protein
LFSKALVCSTQCDGVPAAIERLLLVGERMIAASLIRLMQTHFGIVVLNPVIAFIQHGGFILRQLREEVGLAQQREVVVAHRARSGERFISRPPYGQRS